MNIPSKTHRSLAIVGVLIGMLMMTDTIAYGRTRVSARLRTPIGDVYLDSGPRYHRYYRHRYYYPGYSYGYPGYYYGPRRYYYGYPRYYRSYRPYYYRRW